MEQQALLHARADTLTRLEGQVEALIEICQQLRRENYALRKELQQLSAEKERLFDKHHAVESRIEDMIEQLKTMENDE